MGCVLNAPFSADRRLAQALVLDSLAPAVRRLPHPSRAFCEKGGRQNFSHNGTNLSCRQHRHRHCKEGKGSALSGHGNSVAHVQVGSPFAYLSNLLKSKGNWGGTRS
jgi:hypothetical protein